MLATFNPRRQEPIHFVNFKPYIYNPAPALVDFNQGNLGGKMVMPQPLDTFDKINNHDF